MKEPYGEGLASHTDPESCVDSRKAGHEALTVVSKNFAARYPACMCPVECRSRLHERKATPRDTPARASLGLCEVGAPRMHGNSSPENRETLPVPDTK